MQRTGYFGAIAAALAALLLAVVWSVGPSLADGVSKRGKVAADTSDDYLSPPSAAKSWTGWYLGVGLGLDDTSVMGFSLGENILCRFGGGYDHQIGGTRLVVGLMVDATIPCNSSNSIAELDWSWYGGVRLGALFSDHLLAYGSLGYTTTELKIPGNFEGVTLGAGAELMVTKHLSLGVDWRHISQDASGFDLATDQWTAVARFRF